MDEGLQEKDEAGMCTGKGSESGGHCCGCAVVDRIMSKGSREAGKRMHGILVKRDPL